MGRPKEFDEAEVLERAVELFWARGYQATSVQDIVDHVGVNRQSLYNEFGGKDALFLAALRRYMERYQAALARYVGGVLAGLGNVARTTRDRDTLLEIADVALDAL